MFKPRLELLEARRVLAAVSIADITGEAGSSQAVPINIDTAAGVRAAEIRLVYDTQLLDLNNSSVAAGTVWSGSGDTQVVANVDDSTGSVIIFISSANPLTNVAGSLATLNFAISADAAGNTATLDLVEVVLNEGAISVTPAPQAGPDATDGELTIEPEVAPGIDSISGFVFADADGDGQREAGEAIPGVTIRLINTSNSSVLQTTTDDTGQYQFNNVPAGSYRIEQIQPLAFIDQSPNTLNVQLSSGQELTNQNFIERGLRAAQHYTRLLTTLVRPIDSTAWRNAIRQLTVDANQGTVAPAQAANDSGLQTSSVPAEAKSGTNDPSASTASAGNNLIGEGEAPVEMETLEQPAALFQPQFVSSFVAAFPSGRLTHIEDSLKREKQASVDAALLAL